MVVILAATAVSCSVVFLVWALGSGRSTEQVSAALNPTAHAPDSREIALTASARARLVDPALGALTDWIKDFSSASVGARVQRKLELAGLTERGWTVERVLVVRFGCLAVGVLGAITIVATGSGRESIGLALLLAVVSYLGPDAWLDRKAGERQGLIERQLPDVIDQLSVSVEAGLGFDSAMARSAEGRTGPLADELGRVLQDIHLGMTRQAALDRLLERTDVPDLNTFVVAVRQSTRHGLPIARVLNVQSQELREKRRSRIEEKAAQLPVKIVFPLVFCILPSLFVVILGPAGLNMADSF